MSRSQPRQVYFLSNSLGVVTLTVKLAFSLAIAFGITLRVPLRWHRSRKDLGTGAFAIEVPFSMEEMAFSFLAFALRFAFQGMVGIV